MNRMSVPEQTGARERRRGLKTFLLAATIVAAGFVGMPRAFATLIVSYSTDGGTSFNTLASGSGSVAFAATNTTNGAFTLDGTANSNSPGTPSLSKVLSGIGDITNNTSTQQSIIIKVSDTGFTSPTAPPTLKFFEHIGGTVVTGSLLNTLSYLSCVDSTNNQDACPGTSHVGSVTPNITTTNSSYNASTTSLVTSLTSPYSMEELITVTLGGNADINWSASTDLSPVPEPASMALLGMGLIGLGLVYRRRSV